MKKTTLKMEKFSNHKSILFIAFSVIILILFMALSKWNQNITASIDPTLLEVLNRIQEENKQEIKNQKVKAELLQNLVSMVEKFKNQENTSTLVLTDFQKQVLNETHVILNNSLAINAFQKNLSAKIQRMKEDSDYRGTIGGLLAHCSNGGGGTKVKIKVFKF